MTDYKETPLFKTLKEMMREMMQELKQELKIEMKMMMEELVYEIKPQQNTRHYYKMEQEKNIGTSCGGLVDDNSTNKRRLTLQEYSAEQDEKIRKMNMKLLEEQEKGERERRKRRMKSENKKTEQKS